MARVRTEQLPHLLHLKLDGEWLDWSMSCPYPADSVDEIFGRPCHTFADEGDEAILPGCVVLDWFDAVGLADLNHIVATDPSFPLRVRIEWDADSPTLRVWN